MIESLTEGPEGAEKWYFIIFHNSPASAVARRGYWVISSRKLSDSVGGQIHVFPRGLRVRIGVRTMRFLEDYRLGRSGLDLGMTWSTPGTLHGRGYIILVPSVLS